MKVGDVAYIVENNRNIRQVTIARVSGGLYLVKFGDSSGGIQVKKHRLFATEQEALESIPSKKQSVMRSHYDYE